VGATRFSLLHFFTDCPFGPPSLLYKGNGALHERSSGYSMALTTHPHIMLGSMMSRTMPLLPLYACMACLPFPSSDLQRIRKTQDSFLQLRHGPGISQQVRSSLLGCDISI